MANDTCVVRTKTIFHHLRILEHRFMCKESLVEFVPSLRRELVVFTRWCVEKPPQRHERVVRGLPILTHHGDTDA